MNPKSASNFVGNDYQHHVGKFILLYVFICLVFLGIGPKVFSSTWVSSSDFHACIEITSSFIAIIAAIACLMYYFGLKSRYFLIIGLGFFICGGEDLVHGIIGFERLFEGSGVDFSRFIPGTYVAGRSMLALMIIAAALLEGRLKTTKKIQQEAVILSIIAITLGGGATFLAFNLPLPKFIHPENIISRPVDFISAILFFVAFLLIIKRFYHTKDMFSGMLLACILLNIGGQTYMSFSKQLFDVFFDIAHWANILGYCSPVMGITIQSFQEMKKSNNWEIIHKDGAKRIIKASVFLIRDTKGERVGFRGVGRDVTDRMHAEEALRESEARIRAIVDTAVDGIITIDEQGIVEQFNPAAEQIFGYEAKEIIGEKVNMLMSEPYRSQHNGYIKNYLQTGKTQIIGTGRETTGLRKDGTTFPLDLAVSEVRLEKRRMFTGILRDITERKQAEEALQSAKEEAETANRTKSDFLASMTHEIRTPMNAIIGMAEMLWETRLTPEQQEYVQVFRFAGDNLLSIINDILDISKMEAGKIELETIDFDLRELSDRACEMMALRAHEKGLELACHFEPDVHNQVQGDPIRLRQILSNLIGNAIKFTGSGEVVVTIMNSDSVRQDEGLIEEEPVQPKMEGDESEIELMYSIKDTGIGIPSEKIESIFNSFTQADASITRKYGGTGLGLTISKQLVELMGGQIRVESEMGKGSTFYFTANFMLSPGKKRALPPEASNMKDLKTLVVDDNATNRMILRETLSKWGLSVKEAEGGKQGLDELKKAQKAGNPYQLVILDCRMPGIGGFEVAETIKKTPKLSTMIVMMLNCRQPKWRY